ncbi:hypothetical protein, partial [Extensimonas vulgaris]|uniref:hypothetical protein n=1 Tax=Extensimonas vulgaris TaxID=1031594 RepID=UPI001B8604C8
RIVAGFFVSPQEVFRLKCRGSRAAYAFLFLLPPFSRTYRAASRRGRNKWGGGLYAEILALAQGQREK